MKRRPGSGSSGRSGLFQRPNPAFPESTRPCGLPPEEGPSQIVERLRKGASRRSCFPPTGEPGVPELDLKTLVRPTALELFRGLSDADLGRIAKLCTERRYSRGGTCLLYTSPSPRDR